MLCFVFFRHSVVFNFWFSSCFVSNRIGGEKKKIYSFKQMSFIHYKLITNKNYEKVTFDGVSLSVGELKKLVLEKKFRKHSGPPGSAANNNNTQPNKKSSEVDLEIRCVDTQQSSCFIHSRELLKSTETLLKLLFISFFFA